ncbi:uncharacterized protein VDAG_00124 [Verticillium dahliae VdLs.17]|uniref:Uncharacterized protein n=1 Tax=Verticillium dahliae (strain VdLs.17 / ATCC MYA-4575 / FGSC 10137) TaxID=498257 RepID=G2WRE1_VERDV|nr:uncharacterized protein VDAG_00124 [Verticillium dahliae VdLs.17]EGY13442.1 hypothetical protein VDAG_00124 [Verticillium dahliae VdLs.17]
MSISTWAERARAAPASTRKWILAHEETSYSGRGSAKNPSAKEDGALRRSLCCVGKPGEQSGRRFSGSGLVAQLRLRVSITIEDDARHGPLGCNGGVDGVNTERALAYHGTVGRLEQHRQV